MSLALARPTGWRASGVLALTAAMPLVLVAGWSAADALQPAGFSPVRQTISVAAGHAGAHRWVGTSALLAIGVGFALCVIVLPHVTRAGRVGLLATAACGLGVALCPEAATGPTDSHEFCSVLGAVLLALGPVFTLRRGADGTAGQPGWAQRPRAALLALAVFVTLTVWLVVELNAGSAAGLAERVTSSVEVSWPLLVALSQSGRDGGQAIGTAPAASAAPGRPGPATRAAGEIDNQCH